MARSKQGRGVKWSSIARFLLADYSVEAPYACSIQLLINGLDEWLQPQALSTVVSDYRGHLLGYLLAEREHPSPHSSLGMIASYS